MKRHKLLFLTLTALFLLMLACGESGDLPKSTPTDPGTGSLQPGDALPKGERILEMHLNESENGNFDQSVEKAKSAGAESASLSVFWDDIETAPGVYNPDPNYLDIANAYYPAQNLQVSLVISVLDTTEIRLPDDLEGKALDDPEVINRFIDLLDYVAGQIPDLELTSLAIGNEIDGVLGADRESWQAYEAFFTSAAEHTRTLWPDVPVGSKITLEGLTGHIANASQSLNQSSDVIMVTYYPLRENFTVRDPRVIHENLDRLTSLYPDRKIYITEIGYPTSKVNGSSLRKQAEFIRETFAAWDDHADQIPVLSYSWLTDLSQNSVREYEAYYGLSDPAFSEFLRTLGIRTYPGSGEDKPGYQSLKDETGTRGW